MRIDVDVTLRMNTVLPELIENEVFDIVKKTAELLLTEANRTVPKDTGILLQTGKTSSDEITKTAAVSYDTPYAVRLHEHPEYNFQNGRRGKWLELTMLEQRDNLSRYMAREINKVIENLDGGGI